MQKVAGALAAEGHEVRWVSVQRDAEWRRMDEALFRGARWTPDPVVWMGVRGLFGRARGRLAGERARRKVRRHGAPGLPLDVLGRAQSDAFDVLRRRALRRPFDLLYGGTAAGLAPAVEAARAAGSPVALDFEDLYSADSPAGSPESRLAEAVERAVAPLAAFRTAASPGIRDAYEAALGVPFVAVCNTFPLADPPPDAERRSPGPLRLLWFSQTIGGDRGLDEVVLAASRLRTPLRLLLVGRPVAGFLESLRERARREAPLLQVVHEPPCPPARLAELCRETDVGLCLEPRTPRNKDLCLSNKALFFLAHGVPIACTGTEGQRRLAAEVGDGAVLHMPDDERALADHLEAFARDPERLAGAKRAAWAAAVRRWNWDDAREKGAVLDLVRRALGRA